MEWNETICEGYRRWLVSREKSKNTVSAYVRGVRKLARFIGDGALCHDAVLAFREALVETGYKPTTVNATLCAVNSYLCYANRQDCRVSQLKIQRQVFRPAESALTREEYYLSVETAQAQGNLRLSLIMQTLCAVGLRVSELCYITVEAVAKGETTVRCKRKLRTVFLPRALRAKLKTYIAQEGLLTGPVFVNRSGRPVDRFTIWREMKRLCAAAKLPASKVYPHNLRRLFACCFYALEKDIVKLADLLGHTNVETTRIYLQTSGEDHLNQLERMQLVT